MIDHAREPEFVHIARLRLGKLMLDAQSAFQIPVVFAALIVLSALGIVLYGITALVEQRYTGWAFRSQNR